MPTVLRVDGFRLVILLPPREHGPAHVHVYKAGGVVAIELVTLTVRDVRDLSNRDVRAAVAVVAAHQEFLSGEWRRYHGS